MKDNSIPLLKLKDVTKKFPGVLALDHVSFDVRVGEVHALCGGNGCGKSTLIKVMTGAHLANEGQYFVDGQEVKIHSTQEGLALGISCVYQELSISPQLDLANNLFIGNLPVKHGLIDSTALYQQSAKILETLEMDMSPKTLAGSLSIGQQQMIEIGRALTRNARCILLDEPTSSLSEKETDTLFKIIKTLKQRGISIVYISHKLDEVMTLSDRITVLRDGKNIVTVNTKDISQEDLISHMLGRKLNNLFSQRDTVIGKPTLKVENLCRKGAFSDISFTVHSGEIVGFFGLVGAGRSEIMRSVFGVDKYDSGMVYVEGNPLTPHNPTKAIDMGVGFCPEDRKEEGLMLKLSILFNISLPKLPKLSRCGVINRKTQRTLANEYTESLSIKTPSLEQLTGNLSGGNQQKVVLSKWLMMHPKVLIVDEPTRGIDIGSKAEIYTLLSSLAKRGVAIIIVSSEIEEILGICDRVITIYEGQKTADISAVGLQPETVLSAALGQKDCIYGEVTENDQNG